MVAKQHGHVKSAHKNVKLKAHHAKPYRKRHVGLLVVSIAALIILGVVLVQYRDQIISGFASSRSFVSDLFTNDKKTDVTVTSSHGFNLSYDQKQFYASAISDDTGKLYLGSELGLRQAYSVVRVTPTFTTGTSSSSALTLTFHSGKTQTVEPADTVALQDAGVDPASVTRVSTALTSIGGQPFKKTIWQSKANDTFGTALTAKFVTYSALVRNQVVTVAISLGVSGTSDVLYAPIIDSISFDNTVSYVAAPTDTGLAQVQASRNILDVLTNTSNAAAATTGSALTGSEKVAALYSPAVVKVYNVYCMDLLYDGQLALKDACGGGMGSGFFVSQDGYLGTNGHVAVNTPEDVLLETALDDASNGNSKPLLGLATLAGLTGASFPANSTGAQQLGIIVNAYYKNVASHVTATNSIVNLAVQVTPDNPDTAALVKATEDRKAFTANSLLPAKFVAQDYRVGGEYDGFSASDVAIIKVEGSNFPVTKLGNISDVTQGAGISILGYPGQATDNGVIDDSSSEVTLTTGKVSSIKEASGTDKKQLIETDTTIGHGNSGGPVLDDDGAVVGIATYSIDGSGTGNGTYNYIRNIKDLTDLADAKSISFDTNSATQAAWEKGLDYFSTAHYSKALVSFNEVKTLYPNDSRVADFIASAQKKIANGEDVVDFPLIPVLIAAGVILLGIGVALFLIVRHHKKHMIYAAGVAQGTVTPAGPDAPKKQVVALSADGTTITSTTPTTAASVEVTQTPATATEAQSTSVNISVTKAEEPAPVTPVAEPVAEPAAQGSGYGESTYNPTLPAEQALAPTEEPKPENPWFTPEQTPPEAPKEEPKQ